MAARTGRSSRTRGDEGLGQPFAANCMCVVVIIVVKTRKNDKFSPGQKPIKKSELGGLPAIELLEIAHSIIWQNLMFFDIFDEK